MAYGQKVINSERARARLPVEIGLCQTISDIRNTDLDEVKKEIILGKSSQLAPRAIE